jgi:hypothetical protein
VLGLRVRDDVRQDRLIDLKSIRHVRVSGVIGWRRIVRFQQRCFETMSMLTTLAMVGRMASGSA